MGLGKDCGGGDAIAAELWRGRCKGEKGKGERRKGFGCCAWRQQTRAGSTNMKSETPALTSLSSQKVPGRLAEWRSTFDVPTGYASSRIAVTDVRGPDARAAVVSSMARVRHVGWTQDV